MSNFAKIRSQCRGGSKSNAYASGGRAKSNKTTVNVVVPSGGASGAQASPPVAPGGAGRPPPRPVPPVAANAALGAMGAQPMMNKGGRVKKQPKGGAGGGMGRLQKAGMKG